MADLLDRLTERILFALVWLGLTPSRWPWGSCGTVILQVKGRRSGHLHSTLVTWAEHAANRYLVVMPTKEPQWVKNMRADAGHVILRHGRHSRAVVLRDVPSDQRAVILQVWYKTTSMSSHPRQHFGIEPNAGIEQFERLAQSHAVFRCDESERRQ
jgi:deazaflavin-dependent oxidoreductase (nitroreductase family)